MGNTCPPPCHPTINASSLRPVRNVKLKDRYRTERALGSGVDGVTYLVTHLRTGRQFAAKQLHRMNRQTARSFQKEFELLSSLQHPNIVRVLEMLVHDEVVDGHYMEVMTMVSEFGAGGDMYSYMRAAIEHSKRSFWTQSSSSSSPFTEEWIAGIFRQAMQGVAFLHSRNVAHGDLKPENILMTKPFEDGCTPQVAICDFSMAAVQTKNTVFSMGDPRYLSPEKWTVVEKSLRNGVQAAKNVDSFKADIWAMGVTLFQLYSERIPFWFEPCSLTQFKDRYFWFAFSACIRRPNNLNESDVLQYCSTISSSAVDLLINLLQKDAKRRPSAQEVLRDPWFKVKGEALSVDICERIEAGSSRAAVYRGILGAMATKLHRDHVVSVRKHFDMVDSDDSGEISLQEFKYALRKVGKSTEHADKMFASLDTNKDGKINFDEYVAATFDWSVLSSAELSRHFEDLFDTLDVDYDGTVSLEELGALFQGYIGTSELHKMLSIMDADNDGKVNAGELRKFLSDAGVRFAPRPRPIFAAILVAFLVTLALLSLAAWWYQRRIIAWYLRT